MVEFYQKAKPIIVEILFLSKDAIHIHVGFLSFFLAFLLFKKLRFSWKLLLFPFTLSVIMELMDAIADQRRLGRLLYPAYLHDLFNTNLIPVLVFILLHISLQRQKTRNWPE